MRVFLSYSSKDNAVATRIYRWLRDQSISVWFDKIELRPGDSLLQEIGLGIDKSDILLALITENSNDSIWVKKELLIALTKELVESGPRVIALLMDEQSVPTILADKIYIRIDPLFSNIDEIVAALFRKKYILPIHLSSENLELEDHNLMEDLYEYCRGPYEKVHVRIFNNNFNSKINQTVDFKTSEVPESTSVRK